MNVMRKNIASILVLAAVALGAFAACDITLPYTEVSPAENTLVNSGMDQDYEFTYGLREFMQYSPKNPSGTNLIPYYDFFGSFALKLYVVDGKISFLEITNGDIPCDQFGFELPSGKVPCVFDEKVVPNALRLTTGETIAIFQNGELVFPFVLDCKDLSYKMTFTTLESTREK